MFFKLVESSAHSDTVLPWTKILLVVNVGSPENRSNQPKYKEPRTRSPKTTAKLIEVMERVSPVA